MKRSKKVVVVGAGIIGLCVADALLEKGFQVVLIDKNPTFGEGCSFGNGGIVVPSHFMPLANPDAVRSGLPMLLDSSSPFGVDRWTSLETLGFLIKFILASTKERVEKAAPLLRDLNLASRNDYQALVEKLDVPVGYAQKGLLMLCNTTKGLDGEAHVAEGAARLGLKADVLDRAGVETIEPGIRSKAVGGVFFHDDAHLSPLQTMNALRDRVVSRGAVLHTGIEVVDFISNNHQIEAVLLGNSEIKADEVVLASGAWTGDLAKKLGLKLPLLAGKGYGFTVPNPPDLPRHPAILVEARIAVTPMLDGLRFVGTLELGKPSETHDSSKRLSGLKRKIPDYYPNFSSSDFDVASWSGLRPCSPDGLPYIGRTQKLPNLVIATGHAMMGMSLGPITGRLVSEIIANEPTSVNLNLLSPDRYA